MKKLLSTTLLMCILATAEAQIKIAGDSFSTKTDVISELNRDVDFDNFFPRYQPVRPVLDKKKRENPTGLKFYVTHTTEKRYVCTDPARNTAEVKPLTTGYYEFVGAIYVSDELKRCKEEILKYNIMPSQRDNIYAYMSYFGGTASAYFSINDFLTMKNREKNLQDKITEIENERIRQEKGDSVTLAEPMSPRKRKIAEEEIARARERRAEKEKNDIKSLKESLGLTEYQRRGYEERLKKQERSEAQASADELKKKIQRVENNWGFDNTILPMYIARDEAGHEYYIRANELNENDYIMVPFFEKAATLVGQTCFLYHLQHEGVYRDTYILDAVTQQPIRGVLNGHVDMRASNLSTEYYYNFVYNCERKYPLVGITCEDVVLKDGKILAVFKYNGGTFAMPITESETISRQFYDHNTPYFSHDNNDPFFIVNTETFRTETPNLSYSGCPLHIVPQKSFDNAAAYHNYLKKVGAQAAQNDKKLQEERERQYQKEAEQRKKKYIAEYGERFGSAIADGLVVIGMTQDMCYEAWGIPVRTFRTVTASSEEETWLYGVSNFLEFRNGKLVRITKL